ncbi:MAG: hypothetical protein H8E38_12740 [SAR324 cluster bacterium]|nr:hypothetical protein [SAR324 cluster bacterium]MBL7035346.1 hypothetical protein [SAR324 cluster bacterium]
MTTAEIVIIWKLRLVMFHFKFLTVLQGEPDLLIFDHEMRSISVQADHSDLFVKHVGVVTINLLLWSETTGGEQ